MEMPETEAFEADSLAFYRQRCLDHKLLEPEEETHLLLRARRGDHAALTRLVEANQRLVMSIARRYYHAGMTGDLSLMDLIQWGNIGLLEAIHRWDGRRLRFSTYAVWWIRAWVRRSGLTRGGTLTRTAREGDLIVRIRRARNALHVRLGREPTLDEIAHHSGISRRLVGELTPVIDAAILSLEREDEDGRGIENRIRAAEDTEGAAERRLDIDRLKQALCELPPAYARVIALRYGLTDKGESTYAEIARSLGVSRARIQEIERIALRKLRSYLEG